METGIAIAVIAGLIGVLAFIIKMDISSAVRKEEMETVKVTMDHIIGSADRLAQVVNTLSTDMRENYVRKESINGHLGIITEQQRSLQKEMETKFNSLNEKIDMLTEFRSIKEQIRTIKTGDK
jgi:cadmium resistance protein CadD (predicted permease)